MVSGPDEHWKINKKRTPNRWKNVSMTRWMLGWMLDGSWIDFLSILGPFWEASWCQVGTKLEPKPSKNDNENVMRFWMALGPIFNRFWDHFGRQVGTKLAPKSKKRGYQNDVKKWMIKQSCEKSGKINKGGGALKSPQDSYPEGPWDPRTLHLLTRTGTLHPKGAWPIFLYK